MLIIGIDPGLSGAVSFYHTEGGGLTVEDIPTFRVNRGGKEKRDLNGPGLAQMIDFAAQGKPVRAFVELVGAMPGQGIASTAQFMRTTGRIIGILEGQFIQVEQVPPQVWKREVGIRSGAGKDVSRQRASQLFPRHAGLFARAKDDGRAEAALIALYGARQMTKEAVNG